MAHSSGAQVRQVDETRQRLRRDHMHRGVPERLMPCPPQPFRVPCRAAWRKAEARVLLGLALAILLVSAAVASARAEVGVDLELVLAIDSSGSVDFGESELQM